MGTDRWAVLRVLAWNWAPWAHVWNKAVHRRGPSLPATSEREVAPGPGQPQERAKPSQPPLTLVFAHLCAFLSTPEGKERPMEFLCAPHPHPEIQVVTGQDATSPGLLRAPRPFGVAPWFPGKAPVL